MAGRRSVELVNKLACPDCEVTVHDMREKDSLTRAERYGITSLPSVGDRRKACRVLQPRQGGRRDPARRRSRRPGRAQILLRLVEGKEEVATDGRG